MSFRLQHDWTSGSHYGMRLSTCSHCTTLRVEKDGYRPYFFRPGEMIEEEEFDCYADPGDPLTKHRLTYAADGSGVIPTMVRKLRMVFDAPPCTSPPIRRRPAPW